MRFTQQLTRVGNAFGVWLYRVSNGRLPGSSGSVRIGLLTVHGRRSGKTRTTPLGFFPYQEGFLVVGTASGSPQDPQWFRNLRAARQASIQIGSQQFDVDVRIAGSTEREALWREAVLVHAPRRHRYAEKARRTIPIAILIPRRRLPKG